MMARQDILDSIPEISDNVLAENVEYAVKEAIDSIERIVAIIVDKLESVSYSDVDDALQIASQLKEDLY